MGVETVEAVVLCRVKDTPTEDNFEQCLQHLGTLMLKYLLE